MKIIWHDLLNLAESVLFASSVEERGVFTSDFLRTLLKRHVPANEEWTIGKIAPIMIYEMILHRFYD